jgi:hypothetical protein
MNDVYKNEAGNVKHAVSLLGIIYMLLEAL